MPYEEKMELLRIKRAAVMQQYEVLKAKERLDESADDPIMEAEIEAVLHVLDWVVELFEEA